MKVLNYAAAAALCTVVTTGMASAATYTYNVFDHTNGTQTNAPDYMDYGLRLDALAGSGNPASFWSFEDAPDGKVDVRNGSLAQLTVDISSGTATLNGQMRSNFDNSIWDINVSYSDLTVLSGAGATTSFGAATMTGVLTDGTTKYDIVGKKKQNGLFDYTLSFESGLKEGANNVDVAYREGPLNETSTAAGWVSSLNGGTSMISGTNDFLYTVELAPVPLPAAAWMLIVGLGGLGFIGRLRRA